MPLTLAEWASLHPSQPGTSPPLIVPLLLRVQLVFLALMVGLLAAGGMHRTSAALVIAVFAIAQIPPLEIVYDPNNLNYRQQLIMAMASLILGLAALRLRLGRARVWLIVCAGAGWYGDVVQRLVAVAGALWAIESGGRRRNWRVGAVPKLFRGGRGHIDPVGARSASVIIR